MNRREFIHASAAGLALSAASRSSAGAVAQQPKRVGLIGCGWYGKCDLFRLIQVAPVEVVSLCDVDRAMLANAAEMVAGRQASKKTPRTYGDYREMLKEKDLDIVLVATPDHWHALPMIAAVEAGADVYVQKPISVDVVEGQAMLSAARGHGRVVQVGTQRRSTPHIIEARDRVIREGKLGKIALVEVYCYHHMRPRQPARHQPARDARLRDVDRPGADAALQRPGASGKWRSFTEYGNGIMGDMCIHMFDMTRWMLELGWPRRISSTGGILVDRASKANIPDTQTATFEFPDLPVVWQLRTWGQPVDPKYPWGATFYGDKGTLKVGINSYDFVPAGNGCPFTATSSSSSISTPRTRRKPAWRSRSPRRSAGTCATSWPRSRAGQARG